MFGPDQRCVDEVENRARKMREALAGAKGSLGNGSLGKGAKGGGYHSAWHQNTRVWNADGVKESGGGVVGGGNEDKQSNYTRGKRMRKRRPVPPRPRRSGDALLPPLPCPSGTQLPPASQMPTAAATSAPLPAAVSAASASPADDAFCASMGSGFEEGVLRLLEDIDTFTQATYPDAAHMHSGFLQGMLLKFLCDLSGAKRVLELGTFTAYGAVCLAQGNQVVSVTTVERDRPLFEAARGHAERSNGLSIGVSDGASYGAQNGGGRGIEVVHASAGDWLRRHRGHEGEHEGGHGGDGVDTVEPFDLVFLDADKRRYGEYRDLLIEAGLLRVGGLLVTDNVLFKGLVAGRVAGNTGGSGSVGSDSVVCGAGGSEGGGSSATAVEADMATARRYEQLAQCMRDYLEENKWHPRLSQVVLPIRDGLSCCILTK